MNAQVKFDYTDQLIVITGGTRGIGRALTEHFLRANAKVIATYRSNDEKAEQLKTEYSDFSERLILRKFDVSNAEEVKTFWTELSANHNNCSVLINNSGIRRDSVMASMENSNWDAVLDTNLKGTFLMSKEAVLYFMKKRYGRIINMSSVGGKLGLPGQANYAASKAAQVAMSKVLSKEVGKRNITVNNVLPGFIDTELLADLPDEQIKEYKRQIPIKRFGTTTEVANTVLFLASKEAAYINGASIEVSGGL
ncbi:MAG: 3-oxoacyl-ACP reductase FabG [Bacteriovoracaceae bacterium]|jgi:3-oxoacyl-[acyl-carrier protein] reductase|nr:3-oxoacyl-ACP reductase FabG [Bacteriovoracaceae bacterium]